MSFEPRTEDNVRHPLYHRFSIVTLDWSEITGGYNTADIVVTDRRTKWYEINKQKSAIGQKQSVLDAYSVNVEHVDAKVVRRQLETVEHLHTATTHVPQRPHAVTDHTQSTLRYDTVIALSNSTIADLLRRTV